MNLSTHAPIGARNSCSCPPGNLCHDGLHAPGRIGTGPFLAEAFYQRYHVGMAGEVGGDLPGHDQDR
ncbi:uncharacterized protein METZ01_LOCUS413618 [marine metagenome]|uniref:Uncharacterized protein n=1 Tax=marine metagenome TaxID=408172 RepID=A0A382WQA6_9ZZZZ